MFNNIGAGELLIIGLVIMILFGSKKLPELTRSLSEAGKEFRKGLKEEDSPETLPEKNTKVDTKRKGGEISHV